MNCYDLSTNAVDFGHTYHQIVAQLGESIFEVVNTLILYLSEILYVYNIEVLNTSQTKRLDTGHLQVCLQELSIGPT